MKKPSRASGNSGAKQVLLHVFDNEPIARMAEQRLHLEGVPALVRSLHGGPGLWGSAFNLPHGLYVFENDEAKAREIIGVRPGDSPEAGPPSSKRFPLGVLLFVIGMAAALTLTAPAWTPLFR